MDKRYQGVIRRGKSMKDRQMYKILKGQSEAVNPRKADNTIDKCTRY